MKGGHYGRSSALYDYMPYKSLDDMVIEKRFMGQTVVVEYRYYVKSAKVHLYNALNNFCCERRVINF